MNNITEYLLANREHLKELVSDLTRQREELLKTHDHSFHKDVHDQYNTTVRLILMSEVSKAIGESTENVMLVLEQMNLDMFLDEDVIEIEVVK